MDAKTAKEINDIIKKYLDDRGLTEEIIEKIIANNPEPFDSKYEKIVIEHFDFKR